VVALLYIIQERNRNQGGVEWRSPPAKHFAPAGKMCWT